MTTTGSKKPRSGKRKPLSEADRAAAAEARAEKLQALHEDLAGQVETLTTSEGWAAMLRAAARFRHYSMHNTLLIALQMEQRGMPLGQRVAGFTTWKTVGRSVRRGERGIAVLAPCTYRPTGEPTAADKQAHTEAVEWGEIPPGTPVGQGKRVLRGFKVAYVFALQQTEGEPLPEPPPVVLPEGEAPAGLWDGLVAQVNAAGYRLEFGPTGDADGYSDPQARVVRIREGLADAAATVVLAHELAHVLLHCGQGYDYAGHRGTAEIEAESVAYLVLAATGLASEDSAVPYVAGWASGDVAQVKAAAQRVVSTAHAILDRLDRLDGGQGDAEPQEQTKAA